MENGTEEIVSSKKDEIIAFFLILGVVLPLTSVAIMGGYGFIIWMGQLLFGPTSY